MDLNALSNRCCKRLRKKIRSYSQVQIFLNNKQLGIASNFKGFYMKKKFTLLAFIATIVLTQFSFKSHGQNQVYWRESFTNTSTVVADQGASSVPYTYVGDAGTWTMYGVWQTTGTSCVGEGTVGATNRHIRSTNAVIDGGTPGVTEDDTAYMITPAVSYGINEIHIYRSRNNRRLSIYKSSDALPNTTNWVLATVIPKSVLSPATLCTDTTIVLNDANAKQIRFRFERAGNSDVDSVVLTSVSAIPMPVNFLSFNAAVKTGGVEIRWSTAEESNILRYVVERSTDGSNFNQAGIVSSSNRVAASYSYFDASPAAGVNYYRIKAVELDGNKLTGIMKVTIGKKTAEMVIASNPIKGNILNLQLSGMEKGSYTLSLFNNVGQRVFQKAVMLEGSSLSQNIQLSQVGSGIYTVTLQGTSTNLTKKIIIE
jgi:hypothetical protein